MSLTINTNINALDAQRNLANTENMLAQSMERLSSGLKINSAADDVAGYAINQRLQSQINGLGQAEQNSQDAVALAQTAQGALNDVTQMLQRTRELAVQYENGTNSESDKEAIEGEVKQLNAEIKRVGETTQFNGISLFTKAGEISFQVGSNEGAAEKISVKTVELAKIAPEVELKGAKASKPPKKRSRKSRRPPANSVRSRIACSTPRATWRSTARTSRPLRARSSTPTWRLKRRTSPRTRCCSRPACPSWRRPSRCRRQF